MNLIKKIYNTDLNFYLIILKIDSFLKLRLNLSWYFLKLLLKKSGEEIYFKDIIYKKYIIETLYSFQKKNNKILKTNLDSLDKNVLNKVNNLGICKLNNFRLDNKIVSQVNNYFNNARIFYDNHIPIPTNKKIKGEKSNSPYISYDLTTQLNCTQVLNICLNEKLYSIAQEYIGSKPQLYSLNTFRTLPQDKFIKDKHFTHEFHRDLDNLKWLVFFIFWSPTDEKDGGLQQLKFSHTYSDKLENLINLNSSYRNSKEFINKTIPGYSKDKEYLKIFQDNIYHAYGSSGTVFATDTFGLHKGMPVIKPRLVTWIRYGNISSRQSLNKVDSEFSNKAILEEQNKNILLQSKYKDVLSELVEN